MVTLVPYIAWRNSLGSLPSGAGCWVGSSGCGVALALILMGDACDVMRTEIGKVGLFCERRSLVYKRCG